MMNVGASVSSSPKRSFLGSLVLVLVASASVVACGSEDEYASQFGANDSDAPEERPGSPNTIEGDDDVGETTLGACAATATAVNREPANVLLLVDRSGSMHIRLPTGDTRWQATKTGLNGLLDALPATTQVGAMMFPQGDAPVNAYCGINASLNDVKCTAGWPEPNGSRRCDVGQYSSGVPTAPLTAAQSDAIKSHVSASDAEFYWGTPLAPALNAAISTQKSSAVKGARSVILLTDGNPTSCSDTGLSNDIGHVVNAARGGVNGDLVRTFVIGVIDDARQAARAENLSPVAVAGGTARFAGCEATNECFYAVNASSFATDIKKAFEAISLQAFDCTFPVPQPKSGGTPDPTSLNVEVTGAGGTYVIPRDTSRGDGWDYLPGGTQLQVYGDSCKKLADDGGNVKIVVGCKTVVR